MSVTVRVSATRSLCHWRPRVDTITAQTVGELIDTLRRNLTDRGASLETANHLIAAAFLFPHNWGTWIQEGGVRINWPGGYVLGHGHTRQSPSD